MSAQAIKQNPNLRSISSAAPWRNVDDPSTLNPKPWEVVSVVPTSRIIGLVRSEYSGFSIAFFGVVVVVACLPNTIIYLIL